MFLLVLQIVIADPDNSQCVLSKLLNNLSIFSTSYGIGLQTPYEIEKGQRILSIPYSCSIDSKTPYPLFNLFSGLSAETQLIIRFIYEKSYPSSTFISEYMDFLPRSLSNFPFWEPFECELFSSDPDPLFTEEFQFFQRTLESTEYFSIATWENWKYALGIIASRGFLYVTSTEVYPILIPVLDFLNYDPTYIKDFKSGYKILKDFSLVIEAERNFSVGEEVVWSYGIKDTNRNLLWTYGFIIENNPYHCIDVEPERFCKGDSKDFSEFLDWDVEKSLQVRKKLILKFVEITKKISKSQGVIHKVLTEESILLQNIIQKLSNWASKLLLINLFS